MGKFLKTKPIQVFLHLISFLHCFVLWFGVDFFFVSLNCVTNWNHGIDEFFFRKQDQVLFLFKWNKLWSATDLQSQHL